jgi:hypothetical protein
MRPDDVPKSETITQLQGPDTVRGREAAVRRLRAAACRAAPDHLDDAEPDEAGDATA